MARRQHREDCLVETWPTSFSPIKLALSGQKDWNSTFRTECLCRAMSPNARGEKPIERTQRRPAPGPNHQRLVEAVKPLSKGPLAAPPADQAPGMELARLRRCVKAAKPFKSTISSHVKRVTFHHVRNAISVPVVGI